jgi:hypothetical protein
VFRYVLKGFITLNVKLKRKFRITGFYPDWANPYLPDRTCHCFAFMLIVIFPYQEAIRPYLEAFLFSWDSFHPAGSLSNIIAGFDTDVHALV